MATGLTGALSVTTTTNALSIATGSGGTTINDAAMTGALTLTGAGAATVTALGGDLTATGESGALTVTTNGARADHDHRLRQYSIADGLDRHADDQRRGAGPRQHADGDGRWTGGCDQPEWQSRRDRRQRRPSP